MRAFTLQWVAIGFCTAACARIDEAGSLRVRLEPGDGNLFPPRTTVWLEYGGGCPQIASDARARANGAELPLVWAGGMTTTRSSTDPTPYSTCGSPAWSLDASAEPSEREVIEVTQGKFVVKATFETPVPSVEVREPVNGRFPGPGPSSSATVVVRAALSSPTVREPVSARVVCEGLRQVDVTLLGDGSTRYRFDSNEVPTRSTTQLPAISSGTHRCSVLFTYELAATECDLPTCTLSRNGAQLPMAGQPDTRLGFDLVFP